jgi:hypothetical protein
MGARRPQRPPPGHSMLLPRTGADPAGSTVQRAFDAVKATVQQVQKTAGDLAGAVDDQAPGRLLATPLTLTGSGSGMLPAGTAVIRLRGIGQGGGGGGGGAGAAGAGGSSGAKLMIDIGTPGTPLPPAYSWISGSGAGLGGSAAGGDGTAGADSTFKVNGATYTAKGGGLGHGVPATGAINAAVSTTPAAGSGPGGLVTWGIGDSSFADPGVVGFSGHGGGTDLGAGGSAVFNARAGNPGSAAGFGGGGSGGIGGAAGGDGAPGGWIVEFYS